MICKLLTPSIFFMEWLPPAYVMTVQSQYYDLPMNILNAVSALSQLSYLLMDSKFILHTCRNDVLRARPRNPTKNQDNRDHLKINRIYDGVEVKKRKSQASFRII